MVASLRYLDTFVKTDGAWLFAERLLYVDWVDERALSCRFRRDQRHLAIVGATGMVGGYAFSYSLDHPAIGG